MNTLNLNVLETLTEKNIAENIDQIFIELLNELKFYLKLDIINSQVKIKYVSEDIARKQEATEILDLGVRRNREETYVEIEILDSYKKFLPLILLREAYYCFVPNNLKNNETIKIFINQIIENDLQSLEITKEWKMLVREEIVDFEFLSSQLDRIEIFLKLQGNETINSANIFFFEYIRRNIYTVESESQNFYTNLLKEFLLKISKSMNNDEIIETIYVLIMIFYKVKSYKALLEYKKYFKEFKENGKIQTDLSLRKFTENIRWINKSTYIAPSYQINWKSINLCVILSKLKFNALIEKEKIEKIIKKLPFYVYTKSSESHFSVDITGWFIIPSIYVNDLKRFLNKISQFGYIVEKDCISLKKIGNFLNLNYFREFYKRGRLINPNHKRYHKKYEINFEFDYGNELYERELSILDFLILDRVRYYSIEGFRFERRSETLKTLKSDLINEVLSQRSFINNLRSNLERIHSDIKLKDEFVEFLNANQKFGFFYIKEFLENLLAMLNLITNLIRENPSIKNVYQFNEFVERRGITNSIEDNILLNNEYIKKIVLQNLLLNLFNNKQNFEKEWDKYRKFYDFIWSCNNLKIFSLKSIIKIIQEKKIVQNIYQKKEDKLKTSYENYKLKKFTIRDIDDIIDKFSTLEQPILKPILISTINTTGYANYYIQILLKDLPEVEKKLEKVKSYFPRITTNFGIDLFTDKNLISVEIYLPNINKKEKNIFISLIYKLFHEVIISLKSFFWEGFFGAFSRKDFYDFEEKRFFYTKELFEEYFTYTKNILGKALENHNHFKTPNFERFFKVNNENMLNLVNKIDDRISRENLDFGSKKLKNLFDFHLNLEKYLLDQEEFKALKKRDFFKKYIKAIKFKPSFQSFGLSEYYLYFRPTNIDLIDLKMLFINSFKNLKYPAFIEKNPSIFIKYIFPYLNPNSSYINWLTKSKKIVDEYCIFHIKHLYQIFNFDHNLRSEGWDLDPNNFKNYIQNVLYSAKHSDISPKLKEFNVGKLSSSTIFGSDSSIFKDLTDIFSWKSIDIKSIIGTKKIKFSEGIISNLLDCFHI